MLGMLRRPGASSTEMDGTLIAGIGRFGASSGSSIEMDGTLVLVCARGLGEGSSATTMLGISIGRDGVWGWD